MIIDRVLVVIVVAAFVWFLGVLFATTLLS